MTAVKQSGAIHRRVEWASEDLVSDELGMFVLWMVVKGCNTAERFDDWFHDSGVLVAKAQELFDQGLLCMNGGVWRLTSLGIGTLDLMSDSPRARNTALEDHFNYLRAIISLNASSQTRNVTETCKLADLLGTCLTGTITVDTGHSQFDTDFQVPLEALDEDGVSVRMNESKEAFSLCLVSADEDAIECFRPGLGRGTFSGTFEIPFTDAVPANMAAALIREMIRTSKEAG